MGDLLWAEEQTAGRGRGTHRWESPPGGFYGSAALIPVPGELTWSPLRAALGVVEALESLGWHGKIKWPNDLYNRRGEKVGGLLCESFGDRLIVGVGVNLHDPGVAGAAGLGETGVACSREELAAGFLNSWGHWLGPGARTQAEVVVAYERRAYLREGVEVRWRGRTGDVGGEGRVIGLGNWGELKVESRDGTVSSLFAEEVTTRPINPPGVGL